MAENHIPGAAVAVVRDGEVMLAKGHGYANLEKGVLTDDRDGAVSWLLLAMCSWQLGHKDEAHTWYQKADEWTEKHKPEHRELLRFRAEASELLGISRGAPTKEQAN